MSAKYNFGYNTRMVRYFLNIIFACMVRVQYFIFDYLSCRVTKLKNQYFSKNITGITLNILEVKHYIESNIFRQTFIWDDNVIIVYLTNHCGYLIEN